MSDASTRPRRGPNAASVAEATRAVPIRLGPTHRRWLHAAFAGLWFSGVLWLVFHYFIQADGPFGPRPHPLEQWWLRLHGLFVTVGLIMLGSVLVHHARRAWDKRKNRRLGAALVVSLLWLTGTGYALYYFASEANAPWLPLAHWLPGLALPLVLAAHVRHPRRRRLAHAARNAERAESQSAQSPDAVYDCPTRA